jgi:uroporphyrinogen-III synthase
MSIPKGESQERPTSRYVERGESDGLPPLQAVQSGRAFGREREPGYRGAGLPHDRAKRVRLLVTRPEPECQRTARALRARGHEVLSLPLLQIEAVPDVDFGSGPFAALVFTSANAVRAVAAHDRLSELAGLPVYVVGRHTRAAAEAAGFAELRCAGGDIGELVRLIRAQPPPADQPLLYLAGHDRAGDLAGDLRRDGICIKTVIVYRAAMVGTFPPAIRTALAAGEIDAVLHYSARTAAAYVAAAAAARATESALKIKHFCLSAAVASTLAAAGAHAIEVASAPTEEALFEQIGVA